VVGTGTMELMSEQDPRVVVIGPDGTALTGPAVATPRPADGDGQADGGGGSERNPITEMVSQPDKVMRIGTMIKQLLEEVRAAPLDDRSRSRLRDIHASSIRELADGLAPELRDELARISLPLSESEIPSDAELRIAQAQLVGWLEGLFHGLQAALVAQQMAARNQLEQMRGRALPGPTIGPDPHGQSTGGPYL
jgi:hypothetical protein